MIGNKLEPWLEWHKRRYTCAGEFIREHNVDVKTLLAAKKKKGCWAHKPLWDSPQGYAPCEICGALAQSGLVANAAKTG